MPIVSLRVRTLTLAVAALAAACGAPPADTARTRGTPTSRLSATAKVDGDHDGIDDGLEQALADKFAPVVLIESDESNWPVNVEWFLQSARLQYHEDCFSDVDDDVFPGVIGTQENLVGPPWSAGAHCGEDDSGYSHPPHRLITTIATDPDGQESAGALTTGYSDQQTFVIPDLPDARRVGSTDPTAWKTYFHAYPTADGGVMLQYWHLFAYNDFSVAGVGRHGGDWDATIHVQLGPDLQIERAWFSRHSDDSPGTPFDPSQLTFSGTHPLMTIDGGGHAAYASAADFCNSRSPIGGTASWPTDLADPLDPAGLRDIQCGPLWHWVYGTKAGGVVWETWTGGTVRATNDTVTHPLTAETSGHGGLVNLGEYNPCTATTCYKDFQGSKLLAGEFHPLNGQVFIRYEGKWGSLPGNLFGVGEPPRGPVFQGWKESAHTYTAWYNQGADAPADAAPTGWAVPPTTTLSVGAPQHAGAAGLFVSAGTPIALDAAENAVAAGNGPPRTFYRFYPVGGAAPQFLPYVAPFSLVGADGPYRVEFYSLDALNNEEAVRSATLVLDATAPAIAIASPTATQYPHSATLTLGYDVADLGAGVSSVVATLDGATSAGGHGLESGQVIDLLTEVSVGPHTFAVDARDAVQNAGSAAVTFEIVVTPESLAQDLSRFVQDGSIARGVGASLGAKLEAAARARSHGRCETAANVYEAFVAAVRAQSGKHVTPEAAAILIADAQWLLARCP